MKTTKKLNLRAIADEKVAEWKTEQAKYTPADAHKNAVASAAERDRPVGGYMPAETRLTVMAADIAMLESEDAALTSRAAAQNACDLADRAEGVALALACD